MGRSMARADPPFNVSRFDGGRAGLYTFLLPIQSIPRAGEGLDGQAGECVHQVRSQRPLRPEALTASCCGVDSHTLPSPHGTAVS